MTIEIRTEDEAVEALAAIVAWAHAQPDSTAGGPTTGDTAQRGRVVATYIHPDQTLGASTYQTPTEAASAAADMERDHQRLMAMRKTRVIIG